MESGFVRLGKGSRCAARRLSSFIKTAFRVAQDFQSAVSVGRVCKREEATRRLESLSGMSALRGRASVRTYGHLETGPVGKRGEDFLLEFLSWIWRHNLMKKSDL